MKSCSFVSLLSRVLWLVHGNIPEKRTKVNYSPAIIEIFFLLFIFATKKFSKVLPRRLTDLRSSSYFISLLIICHYHHREFLLDDVRMFCALNDCWFENRVCFSLRGFWSFFFLLLLLRLSSTWWLLFQPCSISADMSPREREREEERNACMHARAWRFINRSKDRTIKKEIVFFFGLISRRSLGKSL